MAAPQNIGIQSCYLAKGNDALVAFSATPTGELWCEFIHSGPGQLTIIPSGAAVVTLNQEPIPHRADLSFGSGLNFRVGGTYFDDSEDWLSALFLRYGNLPLHTGEFIIGRDPKRCHLVTTHATVSGQHLLIKRSNSAEFEAIDLGSSQSSYSDSKQLPSDTATPVTSSSTLQLGHFRIRFEFILQLWERLKNVQTGHREDSTRQLESVAQSLIEKPLAHAPLPQKTALNQAQGTALMQSARRIGKTTIVSSVSKHSFEGLSLRLGRHADNDIILESDQVSQHHARVHFIAGSFFVEDLGSANGTFLRGVRLAPHARCQFLEGEKLLLGPIPVHLRFRGDDLSIEPSASERWPNRPLADLRIRSLSVDVPNRIDPSQSTRLLNTINFGANAGDFIALMGPSGCGKSTLLRSIVEPSAAIDEAVIINGRRHSELGPRWDQCIAYVPQDDLLYPQLTVREAIAFAAELKNDASIDLNSKVDSIMLQLGLESVANLLIGDSQTKTLSGGQRKRVNIALELVGEPAILLLDEPTSGLASDDASELLDILAKLASERGTLIIATIHQPPREDLKKFNRCLFLGSGGYQLYFGSTHPGLYRHFEEVIKRVDNSGIEIFLEHPRDIFSHIRRLESIDTDRASISRTPKNPVASSSRKAQRLRLSLALANQLSSHDSVLTSSSVTSEYYTIGDNQTHTGFHRQLLSCLIRELKIKSRDRGALIGILLQAPAIALLLGYLFSKQQDLAFNWCLAAVQEYASQIGASLAIESIAPQLSMVTDSAALVFFLAVAAVWFGTSNSLRELVGERTLYLRDARSGLGVLPYMGAKLSLLVLSQALSALLLYGTAKLFFLNGGLPSFWLPVLLLWLLGLWGTALGLLLSSASKSTEQALAMGPMLLIPQVILGGFVIPKSLSHGWGPLMDYLPLAKGYGTIISELRQLEAGQLGWFVELPENLVAKSSEPWLVANHFECGLAQVQSKLLGSYQFNHSSSSAVLFILVCTLSALAISCFFLVRLRQRSQR